MSDNDKAPAKGPRPIKLPEMIRAVVDEAVRIEATQKALVAKGARLAPDPAMMRRAEVFMAIARLLDQIGFHFDKVMAIIRPGAAGTR
jgi:hypothetical protein